MFKACYLNSEGKYVEEEFPSHEAAVAKLVKLSSLIFSRTLNISQKEPAKPKRMLTRLEEVKQLLAEAEQEFKDICVHVNDDTFQKLQVWREHWRDLNIESAALRK